MPHSISTEEIKPSMDEDSILPDAPPANAEAPNAEDGDSDSSPNTVKEPSQSAVKLEDLFDDDEEEDEEFPSSGNTNGAAPSSSPPASPP